MRVLVADAALLPALCDYLSLQGYVAVETSEDEAEVLMAAPGDLEAATELMVKVNIWRARHGAVEVSVNPE